jgi:hypothetical protein
METNFGSGRIASDANVGSWHIAVNPGSVGDVRNGLRLCENSGFEELGGIATQNPSLFAIFSEQLSVLALVAGRCSRAIHRIRLFTQPRLGADHYRFVL